MNTISKTEHPLRIAVLTLSDSRTMAEDKSGDVLVEGIASAGHELVDRDLIPDDIYKMRATLSKWIADDVVQVILTTGGTGFTGRDSTPEAVEPLLDKRIAGFGELFRALSYQEIGPSTIQSRTVAGLANGTLIFCLPGSSGACRTAWGKILQPQLDIRTKPCNFVVLFSRFLEGGTQ